MPGLAARLSASIATAALVAATLIGSSLPAAAETLPPEPVATSTPAPESSGEATAEPTPEPTADPTPAPSDPVEPAPTPDPTSEPSPAHSDTPEPTEKPAVATFVGSFVELSEDDGSFGGDVRYFNAGQDGYLLLDTGAFDELNGTLTVTVAVPTGIDPDDRQALVDASVQDAPLTVLTASVAKQVSSMMVNQMPNAAATHQVYAVLVTPSNVAGSSAAANQTEGKVTTAVAHADDYWNQQSSGSVRFALAGTIPWYKAAAAGTCATNVGSTQLWSEAAAKATTQLGYKPGPNTHLVLFFPSGSDCNGSIGLATVENSANVGGVAWVIGTDGAIEKATLAHELGHNLSLGHANWYECTSGVTGCVSHEYGDLTDVMGFGQGGLTGGALSAPQAIRAGIWPSGSFKYAPKGTTSYKLLPVSGNSGLRGVIVEDRYGIDYFIEFRNYTGEDARPSAVCDSQGCTSNTAGVRILVLGDTTLKGEPGDGSFVLSRTVNGADVMDYKLNQTFAANGISIKVTALSSGSASVTVARNFTAGAYDDQYFVPAVTYDGGTRVGDTWGLLLGTYWVADSRSFQWYRNGVAISGATKQYYTLTNADYLKTITVRLTVAAKGYTNFVDYYELGEVQAAAMSAGTLSVPNASPQRAVLTGFPWGTTFTYQWLRDDVPIAGATAATYAPTASDAGKIIKVRVTPTSAGNAIAPLTSAGEDYGLVPAASLELTGEAKVYQTLSVPDVAYSTPTDGAVSVSRSYVWLRNGAAIAGATSSSYQLQAADAGKTISVRVTASAPGYISHVGTTPASAPVALGTFTSGSGVSLTQVGLKLTAAGTVNPPAGTTTFQWFRNDVAITGATASSYTLVAADYGKKITAKATFARPGFQSLTQKAWWSDIDLTEIYSVLASPASVTFTGIPEVDEKLTATPRTYTNGHTEEALVVGDSVSVAYQWLRSGVPIPGATANEYVLVAGDKGKTISLRITASDGRTPDMLLTNSATSAATPAIGTDVLEGWDAPLGPVLTDWPATTTAVTTLQAPDHGITAPAPIVVKYQWYRGATAITGATAARYKLTAADVGVEVWVRITVTKAGTTTTTYTPVVKDSNKKVYSISALPGSQLTLSTYGVGTLVATSESGFETVDGPVASGDLVQTYVWLRNGVPIAGAPNQFYYTLQPADAGTKVTVRVTTAKLGGGYIPNTLVITPIPSTLTVQKGTLEGTSMAPDVTMEVPATNTLKAWPPAVTGAGGSPSATFTYQWLRDNVAITGATLATYKLTAADTGKDISVRVTALSPGYSSVVLPQSTPTDYSITLDGDPSHVPNVAGTSWQVGTEVELNDYTQFATKDGALSSPAIAIQWLRSGAVITGATSDSYILQAADYGKNVQARITVSKPGYLPLVYTTTTSVPPVAKGVTDPGASVAVVPNGPGVLKAQVENLSPATPTPVYAYKWYRGTVAITGATAATYKLVAADFGKQISVQVTMTRANFTVPTTSFPRTTGVDYSITGTGAATLSGTPAVGQVLTASAPEFFEADGVTALAETPALTYTWYRSGVAIAGQSGAQYTLAAADLGKKITVKVTASLPGRLARTSGTSAASATVVAGTFTVGTYGPIVTMTNPATRTVAVGFEGTITHPTSGWTVSYQWYRHATSSLISGKTAITGATKSSYSLVAADTGRLVTVIVKLSKAGYTTHTFGEVSANAIAQSASPSIDGVAAVGSTLQGVVPEYTLASGDLAVDGVGGTVFSYSWMRDGMVLPGETGTTYVVKEEDSGLAVKFVVTVSSPYHASNADGSGWLSIP